MDRRLQLVLLFRRAGWPAWIGLFLIALGGIAFFAWIPQQQQRIARLDIEYKRLIRQISSPASSVVRQSTEDLLRTRLDAFTATLSSRERTPDLVKTVFAEAQKAGVSLALGEYHLAEEKRGGFATYQMVVPVQGQYLKIRSFVDAVLLQAPCVALEEVAFKRAGIGAATAEVRLRFVFYLRGPQI